MQVFDFTDGVKGKFLMDVDHPTYGGGYPEVVDPVTGNRSFIELKNTPLPWKDTRVHLTTDAGRFKMKYTPALFGAEAVIFCWGREHTGYGFQTPCDWVWWVLATDEWIVNAMSRDFVVEKN